MKRRVAIKRLNRMRRALRRLHKRLQGAHNWAWFLARYGMCVTGGAIWLEPKFYMGNNK